MLTGNFRFLGSNGQLSVSFPLTVLTEDELKDKEVVKDFKEAKAFDSRIDGVMFVEYPKAGIVHTPCSIKLLPAGYALK